MLILKGGTFSKKYLRELEVLYKTLIRKVKSKESENRSLSAEFLDGVLFCTSVLSVLLVTE